MSKGKDLTTFERSYRKGFFFLVALASVLLLSVNLPFEVRIASSQFFLIHTILESGGILVAAMIFIIVWAPLEEKMSVRQTILTGAFLSLCIMEMAHLVTFDGTFAQSLGNAKATSFKLALSAQTFMLLGLLSYAFCPTHIISKRAANISLCLFTLASAAIIAYIFSTTDSTSTILDNAIGPSPAAIGFAGCIGALYLLAGLKLFQRSKLTEHYPSMRIAVATLMLIMSAFLFSKYFHVYELSSLIGYFFKLNAYVLILRALVIDNIAQPYNEIRDLERRPESILEALPDLVFETTLEGDVCGFYSNPHREDLLIKPVQFIGLNVREFLSAEAADTCRAALYEANEEGHSYGQQYSIGLSDGEHRYEMSISSLPRSHDDKRFIVLTRDVSIGYSLAQRLEALLSLSKASEGLSEHAVAQLGLDTLERLTKSKLSCLHFLSKDESELEQLAIGSDIETRLRKAGQDERLPPECAQICAHCVKARRTVLINDYPNEAALLGLPIGGFALESFLSVPIFDGERIAMLVGIGNADYPYNENTMNTVQLFGNELYQMLQRRRAQNESEKNRLLLTSALDNLPVGVAITTRNKDAKFEYFNSSFPALYGVDSNSLTNFSSFWEAAIVDPIQRREFLERMYDDFASGDPNRLRWERVPISVAEDTERYLTVQTVKVGDTGLDVTFVEDVTEGIRREEETRIAATAFSSQEGMLITDAHLHILRVNEAFERSSGYSATDLIGKTPAFLQTDHHEPAFYKKMWKRISTAGVWRGEIWNRSKDGEAAPYSLTISAVKNTRDEITHFVAHYIDLSSIKSAQDTISRLARYDTLTGLPNREYLLTMLSALNLKKPGRPGYIGALMIDLDNFATINETLGHRCGDMLLLQVAQRLKTLLRSDDQVARYGGDEFVILLMDMGEDEEQASLKTQLLAQSFINALEDTYSIENNHYFSTVSIGATLLLTSNPNSQEVLKQLDFALSNAKSDGKNKIRFFDPAWQESVSRRARLLDELRIAINEQQLELFYQPQLNDRDEIVGAEGLVRWNHPSRGLLSPSEFLPIAQESHLMVKIGDEVLRIGLRQLHLWQQNSAFAHLQLSLNITADQFYEERFESALLAQLTELEITPGSLMLEFTESMILGNVDVVREKIIRLNQAEIEFAIDDFGTGYSSLSYLSTLPMSQLKIDQSFVRNIGVIETDTQIVKAIINMADILGLGVIAEGVETQGQLEYLKAQNCRLFQGYLFSRPVPVAAFEQLLLLAKSTESLA